MRVAVLGTGRVGHALGSTLVSLGHMVTMGSRSASNERALAWAAGAGESASAATFADAASTAELVINATGGDHSIAALELAGSSNLAGKVLVEVSNPLDFSAGFPPRITHRGDDSLCEQIQRTFPDARVVKTLNTVNCEVMVNPALAPGGNVFVGGNDEDARAEARRLLQSFGWPDNDIVDCGDITSARGMEAYVLFWVRLMNVEGTAHFNIRIVRGA